MIIPITRRWYKTIEFDGVRYFFSQTAYKVMLNEETQCGLGFDSDTYLMYCDKFEVI